MVNIDLVVVEDRPNDLRVFCEGMLNSISNKHVTAFFVDEVSFPKKEFQQGEYIRSPMPEVNNVNDVWEYEEEEKSVRFLRTKQDLDESTVRVQITVHNFYFFVLSETIHSDTGVSEFNDKKSGFKRLGIPDYDDISVIEDGAEIVHNIEQSGGNVIVVNDLIWGGDDKSNLRLSSGAKFLRRLKDLDYEDTIRKFTVSSHTMEKESGELTDLALDLSSRVIHKQEPKDDSETILTDRGWDRLIEYGILPFVHTSPSAVKSSGVQTDLSTLKARYGIIGNSDKLNSVLREVTQVAQFDVNVLITGERGVGKELIAKILHGESQRTGAKIDVNSATISSSVAESRLFGHEKGAFTDAKQEHIGYIEQADGGTLFFDEVGDMHPSIQPKILRVLEEGKIQREGSENSTSVDVRFIAATNKDLQKQVETPAFRKDLYDRLKVISIEIPPLQDRPEDIVPLFESALRKFENKHNLPNMQITDEAREFITSYRWDGNVRQIQNTATGIAIKSQGDTIEKDDLISELDETDRKTVSSNKEDEKKSSEKYISELTHRFKYDDVESLSYDIVKIAYDLIDRKRKGNIKKNKLYKYLYYAVNQILLKELDEGRMEPEYIEKFQNRDVADIHALRRGLKKPKDVDNEIKKKIREVVHKI